MFVKANYTIAAWIVVIITLVMMTTTLCAQTSQSDLKSNPVQRTFTAPPPMAAASKPKQEIKIIASDIENRQPILSEVTPRIDIIHVKEGNPEHLTPGFYASYKPPTFDTVYIYEGETEKFEVINIHAAKEVIQGDSMSVAEEVSVRMNHLNGNDIPVASEKHGKTNSMIIRTGFIPAQGFGTKRYRFAVKPGEFGLSTNSMISASVHMTGGENIGTILCAITSIDTQKGIFYVETSNEVPKGENINWIIINSP